MKRVIGIALLLLLTACGPLGQPSAEEIVRRAQVALEKVEQAHAVVEIEATVEGETLRLVGEGWLQGEQVRSTVLEASQPSLVGTLAVSDGTTGWLYHPESNRALTGDVAALRAYREQQGDAPTEFDLKSLTEMVDELLRMTDETLVGSEQIAGLDSWHLRLMPNAEAPTQLTAVGGTLDLWIAKKTDLPLQVTYTGGALGEGRITVREYDAQPEFAPALFTFTAPAAAEVVDVATLLPEHLTLAEARTQAPFALLTTAADGAEATLVEVYRQGESYLQVFDGTLGGWTLAQGGESAHPRAPQGEATTVSLRGTEARLHSDAEQGWTMLTWEEKGTLVVLRGSLSPETAIKLAETLQ